MILKHHSILVFSILLTAPIASSGEPDTAPPPKLSVNASEPAIKPAPHQARFLELHRSHLARAQEGPIGLLFLGDSITYQWIKHPDIWEQYYGPYQPANFGIGGDRTQHVLWRIENGALDHISPRVVVLLIGTNNTAEHSAVEIITANTKIVQNIHEKLPETQILVLAIFPRGPRLFDENGIPRDTGVRRMAVIEKVNAAMAKLDDGKTVRFLDIGPVFLGADETIPDEVMPDQLHLSEHGYRLWAETMHPILSEMMHPAP